MAAKEERALEAPPQERAQGEAVAGRARGVQHEPRDVEPREAVRVGARRVVLVVPVDQRRPLGTRAVLLRHPACALSAVRLSQSSQSFHAHVHAFS